MINRKREQLTKKYKINGWNINLTIPNKNDYKCLLIELTGKLVTNVNYKWVIKHCLHFAIKSEYNKFGKHYIIDTQQRYENNPRLKTFIYLKPLNNYGEEISTHNIFKQYIPFLEYITKLINEHNE